MEVMVVLPRVMVVPVVGAVLLRRSLTLLLLRAATAVSAVMLRTAMGVSAASEEPHPVPVYRSPLLAVLAVMVVLAMYVEVMGAMVGQLLRRAH